MRQRKPQQVAHEAMLALIVMAVGLGVGFGYFFAATNANQRCKDAWEHYEREAQRGKRLSASSLTW